MSTARAGRVDERQAVLRAAAAALCERVAPIEVRFCARQGPNQLQLVACWRWPGLVRVRLAGCANLVVESLPGLPYLTAPCRSYAPHFTPAERQAALQAAAALLQDRERLPRERVCVMRQGVAIGAAAVWHWPGLVRVLATGTADLLAQSLPGQPAALDASCV